jgi:hypothetical protein
MRGAMPLPVWAVALMVATAAPFAAKWLAFTFERRGRTRSRHLLLHAVKDRAATRASAIDDTSRTD